YPQLALSKTGTVYLTWLEAGDVFFASSGNDYAKTNVSNNPSDSTTPRLMAGLGSSSDVYLSWADSFVDPSKHEILLSASSDGGNSFGCPANLSGTGVASFPLPPDEQQLGIFLNDTSDKLYVTWQDSSPDLGSGTGEVLLAPHVNPSVPGASIDSID